MLQLGAPLRPATLSLSPQSPCTISPPFFGLLIIDDVSAPKPPPGLRPRRFHLEERQAEIMAAIQRRIGSGFAVPEEWFEELLLVSFEVNDMINEGRITL